MLFRLVPVSSSCGLYQACASGASVLVWLRNQPRKGKRFVNGYCTSISVVGWSTDASVLLAGSITGEVLAWEFAEGKMLLAGRLPSSYAPIIGLSLSPSGHYLVAVTLAQTLQVWNMETRESVTVLSARGRTTAITWKLDGSGFTTNDGVVWQEEDC